MGQREIQEDIRQLTRYSTAHLFVCLPFVALGGFGVIAPWIFTAVAAPLGALVGFFTLRPPRAGVLAGIAGMSAAAVLSWIAAALGAVLDPRSLGDPRWAIGFGVGAVIGCLLGWYVWDVLRPQPPT